MVINNPKVAVQLLPVLSNLDYIHMCLVNHHRFTEIGIRMAPYKLLIVLVLSLIVLLNPCFGLNEVVTNTCQQTRDPQFCLDMFKSDARSDAVRDANAQAKLALSIAIIKIQETLDTFPEVRDKLKDPVSQHRLDVCKSDYDRAHQGYTEAYFRVEIKAYWDAMMATANATKFVSDCENVFHSGSPITESPFAAVNQKLTRFAVIIYGIISVAA